MRKCKTQFHFILILFIFIFLSINPLIENNINNDWNDGCIEFNHEKHSFPNTSSSSLRVSYFNYYKEITIDHTKVAEDLTNFPLLISIDDMDLHTEVQPDGNDIAFNNGSDWLDYEIELFNQSYDEDHARLVAWVKIPSISSSTDTKIYMYYGNSTMEAQENSTEVWESNYKAVWHLNTTLLDSTSNNNDGTNYGAEDVSAHIGNGRYYDGVYNSSNMGSGTSIDNLFNGGGTISAWINPEGYGGGQYGRILAKTSVTGGEDGWAMCVDGFASPPVDRHLLFFRGFENSPYRGLWLTPSDSILLDNWYHIVVTYDDSVSTNPPTIYINGQIQTLSTDPDPPSTGSAADDSPQSVFIGNFEVDGIRAFDGIIDEVRMSSGKQSSGWILTEYRNQNDPNSFYTVSAAVLIDTIPPDIIINSPNQSDLFGNVPPNFNVQINDNHFIDKMWYRLLNGTIATVNTTFTTNGTISQTRWNEIGNGTVTIQFFANDTLGNIGFSEVVVRKDVIFPSIVINSPNNFDLFGSTPPSYNVEIWDKNDVVAMWYTLNNGLETYFSSNGTISQSGWSLCGNGTVSIKFYANDSLGNEGFSEVIVRKEIESPTITINYPNDFDLFGKTPPNFNVEIRDNNTIDDMWYTLNNGIETPFTENGTILQSAWDGCGNGTVSIKFYANNSLGNTDFSEIIVRKDMKDPTLTIFTPYSYELYGRNAPSFNVIINDPNGIDTKWYTIDGGITNTTFTANGIINQSLWETRENGTVTIRFYANDSLGNEGYSEVIIRKDIEPPLIQINSPNPYEIFGASAPSFNVKIVDSSGINLMWYSINNGTDIIFNSNDTIYQPLWSFEGNGTVSIKFYGRDSLGNEGFSEVIVRKDIEPPLIQINSPNDDEEFNEIPPTFNVEIWDINGVDNMWYALNDGLDIPFSGNGTISQSDWDICDYGIVSIKFYANDSLGNKNFSEVIVQKKLNPPSIEINNPYPNQLFGETSPIFNVKITDLNGIDTMWYTLDGGLTNTTFNVNESIKQAIWDAFGDESITLRFYANNSIGIIGFSEVLIVKDIYAPLVMINTPNNNSYWNKAPIINIDAYDVNLDKLWCKIGSNNILIIKGGDFQLNTSIWNSLPEGFFQIFIYANDTSGHLNNTIKLNLCKDTVSPNAPIISDPPTGEVSLPLIFDWEEVSDASGIDHYRLIIDTEDNPFSTPGFVFEINISSTISYYELLEYLSPRNYHFFIYAIDLAGNQGDATTGTFTIKSTPESSSALPSWMIYIIIAIIVISAVGSISAITVVRRKLHKKMSPLKKKVLFKIILGHLTKLSPPESTSNEVKLQNVLIQKEQNQNYSENLSDMNDVGILVDEIKTMGEELFSEGAYLEAIKQFKSAKDLLSKNGRSEDLVLISDLIAGIEDLIEEREKRLELLENEKINGDSKRIFELYYDIIEISKKLRDIDVISMYQSELIQYFQMNQFKLIDIEKYRSNLEREADSLSNSNSFEIVAQIYGKCEEISRLLVELEKEEEIVNVEKFRNKKNEYLKKFS